MAEVTDPYLWMEDLQHPKLKRWVSERNNVTKEQLGNISRKLKTRIKHYYMIPYVLLVRTSRRGHFILLRDGQSFKIRAIFPDGFVNYLIDSRELGRDVVLQGLYVSEEGNRYAFSYSVGGSDEGITRIMDTDSNEVLDELEGRIGEITWLNCESFYYVRLYSKEKTPDGVDPPAERVFLRENGKDQLVFGRGIPTSHFIMLKKSLEGDKALLWVSFGWTKSDVYAGKLKKPESWDLLYGKGDFLAWPINYIANKYIVASFDKGGMGRILKVKKNAGLQEIVSEQPYPLQEAVVSENKIVVNYLIDASSTIKTFTLEGKLEKKVKPEPAGTIESLDSDGNKAIFKYESFFTPYRIYLLQEGKLRVLDSKEVKGNFQIEDSWVKSRDATRIHMFKIRKRSQKQDKILAYGYGGFAVSLTPSFYPHIIPFLEDGGTFVVANLRGGKEHGEQWHRKGMRERKQNVFDDFIAVLESCKTKDSKVLAYGISNGGLLVGAVLTQRPELLDGAIIGYPVLDMLRFHKLYIGKAWVPEYGDPDNPKDAEFLAKYSPYHNLTRKKYPPIMLYTGLHDDRVHPAHAFKFAAKLEELGAKNLLRVETKSGHSGATPTTKISELSDVMAFIYKTCQLGKRKKKE